MSLRLLLTRLQSSILRRPERVLAGTILLVLVAAALGTGVGFRTSRAELAPADDPDQQRFTAFLEDYPGSEAVYACVEALPGTTAGVLELQAFVDRLALQFEGDVRVDHVFHRLDLEWLSLHGLHLLPSEVLEPVGALVAAVVASGNLADLNERLAQRIADGLSTAASAPEAGALPIRLLTALLEGQRGLIVAPGETVDRLTTLQPWTALAGPEGRKLGNGYLTTRDGATYFLIVAQRGTDDSVEARRELIDALRAHVESASAVLPGFRVAFTGQPAMVVEELDIISRDTWRTSLVAVLGVGLLTLLVFRWRIHAILVLAALAAGIVWAFGAVRLEFGYLNLITSSFISTLIGVGVAYGIHPVSEYELLGAHTADPVEATREAYRRTGPAVTVAALTTSAAFFSILFMRFRGFAELGLVAGVGTLLCLAAALVSLPALLVVYGRRRARRDRGPRRGTAAVDRLWVESLADRVCRAPAVVVGVALLLTMLAGWGALRLRGFDTDILDLLPRQAESVQYQRKMALESDLSPLFNIVVADDLESLRRMRERASLEPTIERFESVLALLPREPTASSAALDGLAAGIEGLTLPTRPTPLGREQLGKSLDRLEQVLALAAEDAFGAGLAGLAGPLEHARATAESARDAARAADDATVADWNIAQQRLLARADETLESLRRGLATEPPTLENLPIRLKERFLTRSGRPLGFLFPAGNVFDPRELSDYVEASRRVSATATGFPLVFEKMSRRIIGGFRNAVLAGGLLVLLILYIDFRNVRDAVLAMIPLAMGMIWMVGAMRLVGLSFNFANLVAVPLIIGVGIDNGVHIVQRVRLCGGEGMHVVLRHTGRAILISSLTTMIGFGSLALASHRGLSSLGVVLLLGVGACLVTSILVLPNLLVLMGIVKR